jgi:putative ABC transport system permease protein
MILNYLKTAYRGNLRKKAITIINVAGLLLGTITFLFIMQFLYYELSFDKFHKNSSNIYRIYSEASVGDIHSKICISVAGLGPQIKTEFPEVEDFTRIYKSALNSYIVFDEKTFIENSIYWVDTSFFKIFSFPVITNNYLQVLREPNTALISESTALKYFGKKDPINQKIKVLNAEAGEAYYTIEGIYKDIPKNSHISCPMVLSYQTMINKHKDWFGNGWERFNFQTYLKLKNGADPKQTEKKITALDKKYRSAIISNLGTTYRRDYFLQPVTKIHLFSNGIDQQLQEVGNYRNIIFLGIISTFILIITWLNYLNLSIVKGMERAKEIGIRKILGEEKGKLIQQSLLGTIALNLIILVIAILLVMILQPLFNSFAGRPLSFNIINEWWIWISLFAMFILGAALSGIYPSIIISSFNPISVVKGKFSKSVQNVTFKKVLIVIQFAIALFFISGTLVVFKQLNFMQSKNIGMDINNCIVLNGPANINNEEFLLKYETFKKELSNYPNISGVSGSNIIPGQEVRNGRILKPNNLNKEGSVVKRISVDYNYLSNMKATFLAGRNFSSLYPTDDSAIVINRKAANILNIYPLEKIINTTVLYDNKRKKVIGIIENYHQTSPKDEHMEILFVLNKRVKEYFTIKLKTTSDIEGSLAFIRKKWDTFFKGNAFSYFMLSDYYQTQYKDEFKFKEIFRIFSILSLFITCLGLLGLVSYSLLERTKEIGIRKTLGASFYNIYILLSKEYVMLVLLSIAITTPFVYYYMNRWLNNFAFRINLNIQIIIEAFLITLVVTILVSSYYIIKTALTNPTKSLANE